jgi:hypothetical protein
MQYKHNTSLDRIFLSKKYLLYVKGLFPNWMRYVFNCVSSSSFSDRHKNTVLWLNSFKHNSGVITSFIWCIAMFQIQTTLLTSACLDGLFQPNKYLVELSRDCFLSWDLFWRELHYQDTLFQSHYILKSLKVNQTALRIVFKFQCWPVLKEWVQWAVRLSDSTESFRMNDIYSK